MSEERDDRKGEQLHLELLNSMAPPPTRAGCADIPRPCERYACRHNNHVETERPGRPHDGHAPAPRLLPQHARERIESCAMDLADRGPLSPSGVAAQLGTTRERVGQLEERARTKVGLALLLEQVLDEHLRSKMPAGSRIETIYPANVDDVGHVHVRIVFAVDAMHPRRVRTEAKGVIVRRRAPEGPQPPTGSGSDGRG